VTYNGKTFIFREVQEKRVLHLTLCTCKKVLKKHNRLLLKNLIVTDPKKSFEDICLLSCVTLVR